MNKLQKIKALEARIEALEEQRDELKKTLSPLEILWPIIGNAKMGVSRVEGEYWGNKVSGVIKDVSPWGEGSISIDFDEAVKLRISSKLEETRTSCHWSGIKSGGATVRFID